MAAKTILVGVLLIALGAAGYWLPERHSVTALIPAFFGLPLVLLGLIALKEHLRKHAMHAASVVGLLGFLGAAFMSFPKLPALFTGGPLERPDAVRAQATMAVICGAYFALCVNSFVEARRKRQQESVPTPGPS